jgi:hypothetical protein
MISTRSRKKLSTSASLDTIETSWQRSGRAIALKDATSFATESRVSFSITNF